MPRFVFALALVLPLAACAIGMPRVPMDRFVAGDLPAVAAQMNAELGRGPAANRALVLDVLGECELFAGELDAAWRHLAEAGCIMGDWAASGGEQFAAVVGSESSKTYKGDPYEKAMNAFYLALTYLWRGEPDNARASLKRGILADAEVADAESRADNPLLFWLAGRMSQLMGLPEDAEDFFREAREANAFALQHGSTGDRDGVVLGAPGSGNVVLLVACGLGPEKFAAGGMRQLARFRPRPSPVRGARIAVDGGAPIRTAVLCDVDYQARTRGGTEMEGIREGKAVFRRSALISGEVLLRVAACAPRCDDAAVTALVGGSLLALGLLTTSAADARHWPTLPATVQALCLDLPPGPHDLAVEFLDGADRHVPGLDQRWSIVVPDAGASFYLFRSLPGLDRLLQARGAARDPSEVSP
ncbi:MAG: hypothetical protein U1E73_03235 [Planctomycetota bacterium]